MIQTPLFFLRTPPRTALMRTTSSLVLFHDHMITRPAALVQLLLLHRRTQLLLPSYRGCRRTVPDRHVTRLPPLQLFMIIRMSFSASFLSSSASSRSRCFSFSVSRQSSFASSSCSSSRHRHVQTLYLQLLFEHRGSSLTYLPLQLYSLVGFRVRVSFRASPSIALHLSRAPRGLQLDSRQHTRRSLPVSPLRVSLSLFLDLAPPSSTSQRPSVRSQASLHLYMGQ